MRNFSSTLRNLSRALAVIALLSLPAAGLLPVAFADSRLEPDGRAASTFPASASTRLFIPAAVQLARFDGSAGETSGSFSITAAATPARTTRNANVSIELSVANVKSAVVQLSVTVSIVDPSGVEAYSKTWAGQSIYPGETGSFEASYAPASSAAPGSYRIDAKLRSDDLSTVYADSAGLATFDVAATAQGSPLTNAASSAYSYHISTVNSARPGWAFASFWPGAGTRFNGEDHTATTGCFRCEVHSMPSRDGRRVVFTSS
jgi:hypothetical protein